MGDVIPLIIKSVKAATSTIKNSSRKVKQGIFVFVAIASILASFSFTGARVAYNVSYSGHTIATVSSKRQFNDALTLLSSMVDGGNVESVVELPKFSATVVLNEDINSTEEIADAIIKNTDAIVEATTLFVGGSAVACAEKTLLDEMISKRLSSFNVADAECNSHFVDEISYENGYFMTSDLDSKRAVEDVINSLSVVTEVRQVTDVIVPYKSTVKKTNEKIVGYSAVSVKGVSGVDRVTQETVMLNGQVTSSVTVSTETITAPVNEVIVKGTAKSLVSAKQKEQAHNAGFVFPLPSGTWRVSSYYGDGRNHKGVDLAAKSGTSIFAVLDGRVIYSGWKGDYGYCVIIEHSNGMRTLYAHARQVCCSVGDQVSQGEVIALVGTTGQSTGNHLHFEVIVNGRNYDPAPYINLD